MQSDRGPIAHYTWDELRFSISWKAYCFADEAERRAVEEHRDDLSRAAIVDALVADLRARGRLEGAVPDGKALLQNFLDRVEGLR